MTYTDAATTAADETFQKRVRAALYAGCVRIGSGAFIDDPQRTYFLGLLNSMGTNPDQQVTTYAWLMATSSGLTLDSTDADLDAAVTALWPVMSGYVTTVG